MNLKCITLDYFPTRFQIDGLFGHKQGWKFKSLPFFWFSFHILCLLLHSQGQAAGLYRCYYPSNVKADKAKAATCDCCNSMWKSLALSVWARRWSLGFDETCNCINNNTKSRQRLHPLINGAFLLCRFLTVRKVKVLTLTTMLSYSDCTLSGSTGTRFDIFRWRFQFWAFY